MIETGRWSQTAGFTGSGVEPTAISNTGAHATQPEPATAIDHQGSATTRRCAFRNASPSIEVPARSARKGLRSETSSQAQAMTGTGYAARLKK
jgi:hypothetical protein